MNPNLFDHGFAVLVLGLIFPIGGWWAWQRFLKHLAEHGDVVLVREYQVTLIWQAALLACPLLLWWTAGRPFASLGFAPLRGGAQDQFVTGICIGALIALVVRPILSAFSARYRASMRKGFAKLIPLLPRTRQQLFWALIVSLAAGTCEEVAYRGFLIPWLGSFSSGWWPLILSAAMFGFAHLYQGVLGTLVTAAIGAGLGYVYVVTGSLALPMLLHVAIDVSAMVTAYFVLRPEPGEAPQPG
ncbi:MAG TPA: CPBP family intramembrane glutamic endopeptidase [Allosphingosinicella sp.]